MESIKQQTNQDSGIHRRQSYAYIVDSPRSRSTQISKRTQKSAWSLSVPWAQVNHSASEIETEHIAHFSFAIPPRNPKYPDLRNQKEGQQRHAMPK